MYDSNKPADALANPLLHLENELQLFQQLIDQTNDVLFIIDPSTGNLVYANQKASDHLGYSREELLSLRTADYAGNIGHPNDWQLMVQHLHRESFALVETLHTRKDGGTIPVEANIKLARVGQRDYVISVVRDLTRRKAAENALIAEKNKQEALIEAMSDGVTMQDTSFRILYQSRVHQQKQGNHLGEICYKAYRGLDDICDGCLLVKAFADGETHRRETMVMTDNGPFYMEVICTPLKDAAGRITAGIEVVRDITERKKVEQMKEEVLASVGHEMRTPVTALLGFTELLLEGNISREQEADYLKTMLKESMRLQQLIDNLMLLQQLRAGKERCSRSSVPLTGLIDEVLKATDPIRNRHVFRVDSAGAPQVIEADWDKLKLALINLIDNAIKFSPPQSTVSLNVQQKDNRIVFAVHDTGPGIPLALQSQIFDRFYRFDATGHHDTGGTGIGLALVKEIASAHQGRVWVESRPGHGSTFYLQIPV